MLTVNEMVPPSAECFDLVFKGMRLPLKSGHLSDSRVAQVVGKQFIAGEKDLGLADRLIKAGASDRKFLRQLPIVMEITADQVFWRQCDQYKIGTTTSSESQMHCMLKDKFSTNDFNFEFLPGWKVVVDQKEPEFTEEELENEQWVDTHNGRKISNLGRYKTKTGSISTGAVNSSGYKKTNWDGKNLYIHRLVAEAFIPNPENKRCVNHINGNKFDNRVKNLEWVTDGENLKHAKDNHLKKKQLKARPDNHRFSDEEMERIKQEYEAGRTIQEIADERGCYSSTICGIVHNKHRFKDIPDLFQLFAVPLVNRLNELRDDYFEETDPEIKKFIWNQILSMIPQSFNYTKCWSLNYETAINIGLQREGHKNGAWDILIDYWKDNLPYYKEFLEAAKFKQNELKRLKRENKELKDKLSVLEENFDTMLDWYTKAVLKTRLIREERDSLIVALDQCKKDHD